MEKYAGKIREKYAAVFKFHQIVYYMKSPSKQCPNAHGAMHRCHIKSRKIKYKDGMQYHGSIAKNAK